MPTVSHRTFIQKSIDMLKIMSYESIAEKVRQEAEDYIGQIGAQNVISITESDWHEKFSVTVWHHTPEQEAMGGKAASRPSADE
jgi:hypothetical protein